MDFARDQSFVPQSFFVDVGARTDRGCVFLAAGTGTSDRSEREKIVSARTADAARRLPAIPGGRGNFRSRRFFAYAADSVRNENVGHGIWNGQSRESGRRFIYAAQLFLRGLGVCERMAERPRSAPARCFGGWVWVSSCDGAAVVHGNALTVAAGRDFCAGRFVHWNGRSAGGFG